MSATGTPTRIPTRRPTKTAPSLVTRPSLKSTHFRVVCSKSTIFTPRLSNGNSQMTSFTFFSAFPYLSRRISIIHCVLQSHNLRILKYCYQIIICINLDQEIIEYLPRIIAQVHFFNVVPSTNQFMIDDAQVVVTQIDLQENSQLDKGHFNHFIPPLPSSSWATPCRTALHVQDGTRTRYE